MLARLTGSVLVLATFMSGCGHGDSTYGSTSEIAAAIGCQDGSGPRIHANDGYTIETCTFEGHPLSVYTFQKKHSSYDLGVRGITSHVHGSGWDVWCSRNADCVKVQHTIGGDLVHDVPPTGG